MSFLDALINKEEATNDTIQNSLENVAEELNCSYKDLFFMIKPTDEEFNFKVYIYQTKDGKPSLAREITVKEIIGE